MASFLMIMRRMSMGLLVGRTDADFKTTSMTVSLFGAFMTKDAP